MERADAVAQMALKVPRVWAVGMAAAAVLSAATVDVSEGGEVSGSFHPTTLTALLFALIWLPALLRVIALAGGAFKTPAGEAATGGLLEVIDRLDPDAKRNALPPLLAALSSPEGFIDPRTRPIRIELEEQFAAVAPRGVRESLDDYARAYDEVRATTPPSDERTLRMTTITAEARAMASAVPLTTTDLQNMLSSDRDGDRVIALAVVQDQPDPRLLPLVMSAIRESRSAFEQYQALGAAFEMIRHLNEDERKELRDVLDAALEDPTRGIGEDASRARLVAAIRRELEGRKSQRWSDWLSSS